MKYLIVSDIHGSLPRLRSVLDFFDKEGYDMLLLLGDLLNYGPRNGVPDGLDAMGIADSLNAYSDKIVAVRGNCDSEVDQMLLHFPMMADYAIVVIEGKRVFLSHGHKFNASDIPAESYDAIITGHTHLWMLDSVNGKTLCNTGSITFPKEGRPATFATIDEDMTLRVRLLDGSIIKENKL